VGATPRDIAAQRNEAHTPVNSVCVDAASPVPLVGERPAASGAAFGESMVMEGSSSSSVHQQETAARQQEPAGLQDVSFGVMSENNDNSFANTSFANSIPDTSMEVFEDRRASLGYNRRESIGSSVLGAVLEEKELKEDGRASGSGRQTDAPPVLTRVASLDATECSLGGDVSGHWGDTSRVEHVEDEHEDDRVVEVEVGVSDISINSDDEDDCCASFDEGNSILSSALLSRSNF